MKNALLKNWRTSLGALCGFLLAVPGFSAAITAWGNHQAVNWQGLAASLGLAALAAGLGAAKDSATHSTAAEVQASTAKEAAKS